MERNVTKIDERTLSVVETEKVFDAEGGTLYEDVTLSTSTRLPKLELPVVCPGFLAEA